MAILRVDEPCHQTFEEHKSKLSLLPMLKFPECDNLFDVHSGANVFAIGRVLMQNDDSTCS